MSANRWFFLACLLTALVCLCEGEARAQDVDPKQVEAIVQALQKANEGSTGSFDWGAVTAAVIAVLGGVGALHRYAPRMGAEARDPVLEERTRESRREIRRLRDSVHWHAQCLTVIASKLDVELPDLEKHRHPEPDSDAGEVK